MISPQARQQFLQSAIVDLKDYLLSDPIFWPMGNLAYPLTIGNLLLELALAKVDNPAGAVILEGQVAKVQHAWQAKWIQKSQKELAVRLKIWQEASMNWLAEGFTTYKTDARNRAILQFLFLYDTNNEYSKMVSIIDARLGKVFGDGAFIWPSQYQGIFNHRDFWYLYLVPKKNAGRDDHDRP